MSVGIPIKLLYEGLGHIVNIEIRTGELYRGHMANAEDNMNIMLDKVTMTSRDGKLSQLDQIYIRGSQIRFIIFPDMLRHAPMFKNAQGSKGRGRGGIVAGGVGAQRRTTAMRARAGTALMLARRGTGGRGGGRGGGD
eukprot:GHVU01191940.1.p3 GENE.GHVU01191940.1~~GHVU01191940.1.p3  ORF type:complete len:138 (+),score=15.97 GHVU01191940.1:47-460(+)